MKLENSNPNFSETEEEAQVEDEDVPRPAFTVPASRDVYSEFLCFTAK
jgi:hypothetical protein